ncbi:MAG: exopolysaccharide Pel transporter PelG [Spirochaetales bacterium]|nr:exopolysaccharide Pel transporter PelG [Spirochaetales bacterium]
MAGIGFELRRVIGTRGVSRSLGAALSGVMVVAGPWLTTILAISASRAIFARGGSHWAPQFQAAVVYAYAVSLALFAGPQHLFTRIVADLIWEGKQREGARWLVRFTSFATLASACLGIVAMALLPVSVPGAWAYRSAWAFLFAAINALWMVMLFVSLLRRYLQVALVFAVGMAAAVALAALAPSSWGPAGPVLGYAVGHALAAAGLLALSLAAFPPAPAPKAWRTIGAYLGKRGALVLSGAFYYLGHWADKFAFWITRGTPVEGTPFALYERYDLSVYLAGLVLVPGLVYFTVWTETGVASSIRRFLRIIGHGAVDGISEARARLRGEVFGELAILVLFQLLFTAAAAAWLLRSPGEAATVAIVALAGATLQLVLMASINVLYYFELQGRALAAAAAFLVLNALVFPPLAESFRALSPGLGYLVSAAFASLLALLLLAQALPATDRALFLRAVKR